MRFLVHTISLLRTLLYHVELCKGVKTTSCHYSADHGDDISISTVSCANGHCQLMTDVKKASCHGCAGHKNEFGFTSDSYQYF